MFLDTQVEENEIQKDTEVDYFIKFWSGFKHLILLAKYVASVLPVNKFQDFDLSASQF